MMLEISVQEYKPKEMTPTAWKTPLFMSREPRICPFMSEGTRGPCVITVIKITSMLSNANVLAFASCVTVSDP